jgi:uncharacterized protein (DUF433 family)
MRGSFFLSVPWVAARSLPGVAARPLRNYPAAMDYLSRITVDPDKRGGKPCIRGLRITVYDVLDCLASGMTAEQVVEDFPDLTVMDVRACLAFAADRERRLMSAAG